MSQTSSHAILQEQRTQYPGISDYKRTPRSRSGSQVKAEHTYTERVSSLPKYSRNLNAKATQENTLHNYAHSNDIASKSKAKTHRRTTSFALDDVHVEKRSTSMRRDSAVEKYSRPAIMNDVLVEAPRNGGRLRTFYQNNRGLAYVLLAQVFGCLMNVTTRLLEIEGNRGEGMHPFQILFVRMAITTTLSTVYMWWSGIPYFPFGMKEVRWLLLLRGIGGFFGVFGMYYSLLYLPLADATVITFISPCISCFACSILIKEPFTRLEQFGALTSFIGVTLIARPTTFFHHGAIEPPPLDDAESSHSHSDYNRVTSSQRFSAVSVALVGVLGQAMAFTTMRWMGKRAHPLLSVNYFCAMCTLVSALAMIALPGVPFLLPADFKEWSYLIFLGICGFAMQFLLSAGLQIEKSSRATNMVYTQMLFALIFDKAVFGTDPSVLSLVGSSLILGSAIYVAVQKESLKQRLEMEKASEESLMNGSRGEYDGDMEMRRRSGSMGAHLRAQAEAESGLVAGMEAEEIEAGPGHNYGMGKIRVAD